MTWRIWACPTSTRPWPPTDRFLKERPETARKFLRAFIAGIHLWMTDEKKTKEILAKRLRIKDKEVLDETYTAYKKLTEKTRSKESIFRLKT